MDRGAHAADPLGESPGIARVAAAQDQLDAAKHRRRRPCLFHGAAVDFRLDAKMAFDPRDGIDNDMRHHSASDPSSFEECASDSMAHDLADTMHRRRCRREAGQAEPDRVDPAADIEAGDVGEPLIERRHRVPEIRLGATDAGMTTSDRPVGTFVPPHDRTVLRRCRPFASHLVKAVAVAMRLVAPGFHVLPGIEMRAPLAIVVDSLAVGEQRTPVLIERRPSFQGQVVNDKRGDVLRIGRTCRHVDEVLDAGDGVGDGQGAGRVRSRRRDAAE